MKRLTQPDSAAICTAAMLGLLISTPSYAYLDPGTGSIILQGLLAGIAVAIGVVRGYWQQLRMFLDKLRGKSADKKNESDSDLDQTSDIPTN